MGNFYVNYTLRGPSQREVSALLAGRSAIVTPAQDGCVVVFDEESDEQDQAVITELASWLSHELWCAVLAVLNHDGDILWYQLYLRGELNDEYDSSPGYFETSDEAAAMAGPAGGDAQKLCGAFGANTAAEVERILRKSALEEDGYVFAFERHEALAGALGIPSFGVGAGFSHFSIEELPEGLEKDDVVWTKDFFASQAGSQDLDGGAPEAIPGYYKARVRGTGPAPLLKKSIPIGWVPALWAVTECSEQDLPVGFQRAAATHREAFKHLGFSVQGFKKLGRVLNPNSRGGGGINFLDSNRCHFGQLIYQKYFMQSLKAEKEIVVISFTAAYQDGILSCTNGTKDPFPPLPHQKVIRIESDDVTFVYQHFLEHVRQRSDQPRRFPDLQSLRTWFDAKQIETLEERARQGIFVRMSDDEVAVARSKLPPEHSKA